MTNVNVLELRTQTGIRSPEMLLERALPLLIEKMGSVTCAEVYRLARGGMVLWYGENSTYENGVFVPLEANSLHQRAIIQSSIQSNDEQTLTIAPLFNQSEVYALLALESETPLETSLVSPIANELGLLLYTQLMHAILERQIAVTGKLTIATSLPQIATVIAETLLEPGQFVSVSTLAYDDNNQVTSGQIVATANRQQGYASEIDLDIDLSVLGLLNQSLREEGEALVKDVASDQRLTDAGKAWLAEQRIKSIYVLPLWIENQLSAFIGIADTQYVLSPSGLEKELFHNIAHQAAIVMEKQQLFEKTRKSAEQSVEQVRVLRLINDLISRANSDSPDKPLLQKTADILLEVTDADHVGIAMRNEEKAYLVSEAPASDLIGMQIETGEDSIQGLLAKTKQHMVVPDVANDPNLPAKTRESIMAAKIKSIVVLPMFDEKEQLIGSVGLDYFEQRATIPEATIETAQTIVSQVALSLQKLNLLEEAQQKAQQLERLTDFGQSLRAYLTLEEILRITLEYCPGVMDAGYTGILLYDRPSNALRVSATHLHDENIIPEEPPIITEHDNSIALQAWTTHEIVRIDDMHTDWDLKHSQHRELQSIIAVPLSLAGVTLGVLEVGSANPYHFHDADVTTLRQISNQLAIALSNASAYSQSQRLARNKSHANDIIASMQQQLEVNDILKVTIYELGKALGAKNARIRLGTTSKRERDDN